LLPFTRQYYDDCADDTASFSLSIDCGHGRYKHAEDRLRMLAKKATMSTGRLLFLV
jgi:hypothetical protein